MSDTLPVQERFVSIQGEGVLVGTPSSFVRVAGCNLRCTWCDSPATSWAPESTVATVTELVRYCATGPRHVVVTGGEPLLMAGVATLVRILREAGHHVTVETAGTVWLEDLTCDLISISPKLAHSTPHERDAAWAARHEARRWNPEVVRRLMDTAPWQLKLVVRTGGPAQLDADLAEVEVMVGALRVTSDERDRVLLMPECIDPAMLPAAYRLTSLACRDRGFRLGERLHIAMFGHTPGT